MNQVFNRFGNSRRNVVAASGVPDGSNRFTFSTVWFRDPRTRFEKFVGRSLATLGGLAIGLYTHFSGAAETVIQVVKSHIP